ncbi:EamA family transporter [Natronomonas gomsonensis]|jgi:DME family drug/metabolite transporter|uniref:EamA family transporter n=1 Tax=Natronomonas gomsonensis TaxID=1046043 RepID=UPI0020CA7BD1|nr:EamA family transporter [Natronomonas gomsonensis]MCY4730010.1 EamA family transporter [Natronomonas gomsonensis]
MVELLGPGLAVAAALFLAIQVGCIRIGTDSGRSNDALIVVLLVNITVLVPVALVVGYPDYSLSRNSLLAFAAAGLVGTMMGRAFEYAGIERIGASRSEPIKASQPLHAAVLAVLVLGETLTPVMAVGTVLVVVGVAIISWESRSSSTGLESISWSYLALPLASAFLYGIEPIFAKVGLATGTSPFVGLGVKTVTATVAFYAYLRYRGVLPERGVFESVNTKWYVAAGLANSAFLLSYYAALAVAPVVLVQPVLQTSPLFVILISYVFLQRLERVTWKIVAAAGIVALGAGLVALQV